MAEVNGAAWTYVSEVPLTGTPTLDRDLLVVVDIDGGVHALDTATGRLRWLERNECGAATESAGAVVVGDRVFSLEDEYIVARDRETGRRFGDIGGAKYLTAVGQRLLVVDGSLKLALIETDGRRVWEPNDSGGVLMAPPAIHGGLVIAAYGFEGHHTHGGVSALDADSGRLVWAVSDDYQSCNAIASLREEWENDGEDWVDDWADLKNDWLVPGEMHAIVADGRVWATRRRRHDDEVPHGFPWDSFELACLDLADGRQRWTWGMPPRLLSDAAHSPVAAAGLVFVTCTSHEVDPDGEWDEDRRDDIALFAVRAETPQPIWWRPLTDLPVGAPVIAGGQLYHLTREGTVQAISCANGDTAWRYDCGETVGPLPEDYCYQENPPRLIPADGVLYAQTATTVHALQ